jgi:trk system potassium uptake protein TrkA
MEYKMLSLEFMIQARAEIYQRLGIPTVATGFMGNRSNPASPTFPKARALNGRDASGKVQLAEVHPAPRLVWYARSLDRMTLTHARVAFITRLGEGLIPDEHTVLQEGDLVHVMVS